MNEHAFESGSAGYPRPLREICDPPPLLFAVGALADAWARGEALAPAVAIVGARDATPYGLGVARDLAREISRRGFVIVSGLALGVDGAAHRGALEGGGATVAVVGSGTDVLYPHPHLRLRRDILERGAVVSEYPRGTRPRPHFFPRRNRLISGLSVGVIVVEATLRSGSLSTAAHALEQNREVFAVPGPVTAPRSRGPHALLKRGARLVETVDDVLAEIPRSILAECSGRADTRSLTPRTVEILGGIASGLASADEIAAARGLEVSEILQDLLELEIMGWVLRGVGGRVSLSPSGRLVLEGSAGAPG